MEVNQYVFLAALIWSLAWKAVALWRAGRENRPGWFATLFIVQTFGLLEIIYIFLISGEKDRHE